MGAPVKKTMIYVLLDESGSMSNLRADVIGGINEFIDDQRKAPDPAVIGIANFGTHIPENMRVVRPMADLKEIAKLTEADFAPNGGTPLLEAMIRSIESLDEDWKREKPDRCIFAVFTDGEENSSNAGRGYTKTKIKAMVEARQKSGLWLFMFMGANIDSFHESAQLGFAAAAAANYVPTSKGFRAATKKMSESTYNLRGMSADAFNCTVTESTDIGLGGDIGEDGSVTKHIDPLGDQLTSGASVTVNTGPTPPPGQFNPVPSAKLGINQPPPAAMQTESWTPPTSSALYDPKVEAWKPPV